MMEEAPPPPYSETDVFSHPGMSPRGRARSNDDATSVTESSTHGSPIYTPPETPRESHFSIPAIDGDRSIASAHSYFESRPALVSRLPGQNFVASVAITEDASPEDFPYPGWASEHDITEQDWQTFLNYLMPDHAARSNAQTIDRKLQAEDDAQSSKAERSIAEAQLGQIKSSSDLPQQPSHDIDTMVREWNDGFFGPRGVTVQRTPYSSRGVSETPASEDPPTSVPQPEPQPQPRSQPQEQAPRSRWNPFRPFDVSSRGIRIGRLSVDDERVAFGDSFEVDRNGVRWNGLSTNDLRFESDNGGGRGDVPRGPGPGPGPFNNFPPLGRGGFDNHHHPNPMGRGRGGRWWRMGPNQHAHPYGARGHSPGGRSNASSSSSSSSTSGSSIGSLPDWDDLRDSQLPVTKRSISAWLAHPEQPVTKAMVRAARSDIKAARNAPPPTPADDDDDGLDPDWDVSKQALRQEVRSLLARLKDLKREQKRAGRAARKERKEQKRAMKRERKDRRRSSRDARRAERHQQRMPVPQPAPLDPFSPHHSVVAARIASHPVPAIPGIPGPQFGPANQHHPFGGSTNRNDGIQDSQQQQQGNDFQHARGARESALAQADSARAFAASQAARAHLEAQRTADAGRAQAARAHLEARRTADAARAHAAMHSARAQIEAQRHADAARAQAAAAMAAAGLRVYPQQQQQQWQGWSDGRNDGGVDGARGGVSGGNGNGNGNGSKYETADVLEAQIAEKRGALSGLQETIVAQHMRAAMVGEGDASAKSKTEAEVEAEKLEGEIDDLRRDVQRLRLEADEEMARKMAEEEGWHR